MHPQKRSMSHGSEEDMMTYSSDDNLDEFTREENQQQRRRELRKRKDQESRNRDKDRTRKRLRVNDKRVAKNYLFSEAYDEADFD
jgi:hypothetical protein